MEIQGLNAAFARPFVKKTKCARRNFLFVAALAMAVTSCQPGQGFDIERMLFPPPTSQQIENVSITLQSDLLAARGGAYEADQLQDYLNLLAGELLQHASLPHGLQVSVVDDPTISAASIRGGRILISRGLLLEMADEAELASVIAHHIGLLSLAPAALQSLDQVGIDALIPGLEVEQVAYDPALSQDADQFAARLLTDAGYNDHVMAMTLVSLRRSLSIPWIEPISGEEVGARGTSEQIAALDTRIDALGGDPVATGRADSGHQPLDDRFVAALDGLLAGRELERGVIRGRDFIDPANRFRFSVPEAVELVDSGRFVQGLSGESLRLRFSEAFDASGDLAGHLQNAWTPNRELSGVRLSEVAGRPAAIGFAVADVGGQPFEIMAVAMGGPGSLIYRFLFVSKGQISDADRTENFEILASVSGLSSAEIAEFGPARLRYRYAWPGQEIQNFASMPDAAVVSTDYLNHINGYGRGRTLRSGERVKILVRQ